MKAPSSPDLKNKFPSTRKTVARMQCDVGMNALNYLFLEAKVFGGTNWGHNLREVAVLIGEVGRRSPWHIPEWYATGRDGCRPPVELSNVFVRNAFPWLVIELPNDAHGHYFVNGKVWQAIRCGAKDGALLDCVR